MRVWPLIALAFAAGCTRSHYRQAADKETYPIVAERVFTPSSAVGPFTLDPPPGSRIADPFDPDHPPMPPDDPAAAFFMARPGGMHGSKKWGKDGYTDRIEPAGWQDVLGLDEKGALKLTQDRSVELALLNSREYQFALEGVYLQALALTLNRFEFDVRWFARNATTFTHFGTGGLDGGETNTLEVNSNAGFAKNFAAGGQLLVDFANAMVFEYTGNSSAVRSNLAVSFVQPVLRNAGRKVRLEALTQAERDTLYAVRVFARFRKQFWADVAVQSGGYLDLLLLVQQLRNAEANLKRQEETYRLYNELFRGGRASVVEVDQFFQSYQAGRQTVLDADIALQRGLDAFKLRLGLPPRIPVYLDDSLLKQFVLTDPLLDDLRDDLEAFQRARLAELDALPPLASLQKAYDELRRLAARGPAGVDSTAADLKAWGEKLRRPARKDDDAEQTARTRATYDVLKNQLPEIVADLKKATAAVETHRAALAEANRQASWEALAADVKAVLAAVDAAAAAQTQVRIYLIELPDVEEYEANALTRAKEDRLDLQNALGLVTDAWRKVTVAANALRGDLNVVTNANLGTDPDHRNPFAFSAEASRFAVGVQFDGPLNRMAERNAYRASLITYQRAKRAYIDLSDNIEFQVRQDIRALNRLRGGFEISRQQLIAAARQVENARLILLGPRDRRTANDSTTLNLLQAYANLLGARNALAANYINFEQQRVQLLIDLEAVSLDDRGFPANVSPRPAPGGPAAPRLPDGTAEPLPAPRPAPAGGPVLPPARP